LLNKGGSHLKGPCSSPDSNLESSEEQLYVPEFNGFRCAKLHESIGNPVLSDRIQNSAVGTPIAHKIPSIRLRIGAPECKIPTMSVLYLESGEEQGPSK
jgi:hypothetical protein